MADPEKEYERMMQQIREQDGAAQQNMAAAPEDEAISWRNDGDPNFATGGEVEKPNTAADQPSTAAKPAPVQETPKAVPGIDPIENNSQWHVSTPEPKPSKPVEPVGPVDPAAQMRQDYIANHFVQRQQPVDNTPKDTNMMEAIAKLPKEEQENALAEYLASGGPDAYRDYMAMKDYIEDPEAAKKREKKEQRNKNLIAAMNMIGALGNFASAAGHTDGRSVPVANTVEAYDKRMNAEREIRNQNLERANKARKTYGDLAGGIIRQGYKNKFDRDKLAQQAAIEEMKAQNTAARTAAYVKATEANQKRQQELLELKKGKYALDAELGRRRLAIAQQRANAAAGNGSNGISSKTHYSIPSSAGVYNIRKERWNPTTIGVAWSKLPANLQQDALKTIVSTMEPEQANEAMAALQALGGSNSTKWITANANLLSIAIGTVIDEDDAAELRNYLQSISDSGQQTTTQPAGTTPAGNAAGTGAGTGQARRSGTRASRAGGGNATAEQGNDDDM